MLGHRTPSSSKSGGGRALRCLLPLPDHPDYSLLGFRVFFSFFHFTLPPCDCIPVTNDAIFQFMFSQIVMFLFEIFSMSTRNMCLRFFNDVCFRFRIQMCPDVLDAPVRVTVSAIARLNKALCPTLPRNQTLFVSL